MSTLQSNVIRATATEAVELAACNYCKTRPGERCVSRSGRTMTAPHADRMTRARAVLINTHYIATKDY